MWSFALANRMATRGGPFRPLGLDLNLGLTHEWEWTPENGWCPLLIEKPSEDVLLGMRPLTAEWRKRSEKDFEGKRVVLE